MDPKELVQNRKKMNKAMLAEYGYIFCQHCEGNNGFKFEIHHIVFRSEAPNHENLHDVENLICLCSSCHGKFHRNKSLRNGLVEQRGLDKIFGVCRL